MAELFKLAQELFTFQKQYGADDSELLDFLASLLYVLTGYRISIKVNVVHKIKITKET